jgi:hypothetical protein
MTRHAGVLALLLTAVAAVGCVDRRFVVRAYDARDPRVMVPAQISLDGEPKGPAPLDAGYTYTGWYQFHAVADGYQPLTQRVRFKPKWYDYPGLDLFAEVFWPFRIEDVREVNLALQPARPLRPDELQANADNLRARGMGLPPTQVPEPPPRTTPAPLTGQPAPRPVPLLPNR